MASLSWYMNVINAATEGDSKELDELLANAGGELQNNPDYDFISPVLIEAVKKGHYSIAQQLLDVGADVNALGTWGWSPLRWASILDNYDMCCLLLRNGANPNQFTSPTEHHTSSYGTALYYATENDSYNIVTLFLEHGAEVCRPDIPWDDESKSPIALAVVRSPCITKLFLDHCKKFDILVPLDLLLNLAIQQSNEECALLLSQHGFYPEENEAKVFKPFSSCFHKAAHHGLTKLMSHLVELNTQYLQEEWLIQKDFPGTMKQKLNFISWLVEYRKQPSSLQILCKSAVLSQTGMHYILKVDKLPLPNALKRFLQVVESAYPED